MQIDFTDLAGMTGEVTADDIKNGYRRNCEMCPVVLAVERMFGNKYDACIEYDLALWDGCKIVMEICIGDSLMRWIGDYDSELPVGTIPLEISTWNAKGYKYMIDIVATEDDA